MKKSSTTTRALSWGVALGSCLAALALSPATSSADTTLVFQEPHKGATSRFVDVPPKLAKKKRISAGDEFIFTNYLEQGGKLVGRLRGVCTATQDAPIGKLFSAGFVCDVLMKLREGSLVIVAPLSDRSRPGQVTEGAVLGGTDVYAGARGTFVVRRVRGAETSTVTLLE